MTKLQQFKGSQTCEILEKSTIYTVIHFGQNCFFIPAK